MESMIGIRIDVVVEELDVEELIEEELVERELVKDELDEEVVLIVEELEYRTSVSLNGKSLSSLSPLLYLLASVCATRKRAKRNRACILCLSIQLASVS
jgi:hypothetical protein